jgi:hypothetical protein
MNSEFNKGEIFEYRFNTDLLNITGQVLLFTPQVRNLHYFCSNIQEHTEYVNNGGFSLPVVTGFVGMMAFSYVKKNLLISQQSQKYGKTKSLLMVRMNRYGTLFTHAKGQ